MTSEYENAYNNYVLQSDITRRNAEMDMSKFLPQLQEQTQQNQAFLVEQVNPKRVVREIILALMNVEEKDDGRLIPVGDPIMNQLGINRVRFLLRGLITNNTTLSHLEEEQISKLMIRLSNDITDDIALNWKVYEIRDKSLFDYIINTVTIPIFIAFQRALEHNEKNWLGRISVENISNSPRPNEPKKEGFLSMIKL